jgi:hypothetical protein
MNTIPIVSAAAVVVLIATWFMAEVPELVVFLLVNLTKALAAA